jgi:hypothetical protein
MFDVQLIMFVIDRAIRTVRCYYRKPFRQIPDNAIEKETLITTHC